MVEVGSVGYVYSIGQFEISRGQFDSVSEAGNLGIFQPPLTRLDIQPWPDMPAMDTSWIEAARFVNWLNDVEGYPPAYKFQWQPEDLEYDPVQSIQIWEEEDTGFDPSKPTRNRLARFVIPSLDEWFKAAFYDPSKNDGEGGYREFATGDAEPKAIPFGTEPDTAVYDQPSKLGPADVREAGGLSAYGAMGMNGNVWEWMETTPNSPSPDALRLVKGGAYSNSIGGLSRGLGVPHHPEDAMEKWGFRIAMVEPFSPDPGDFNLDGLTDATDIDLLSDAVGSMSTDTLFDLNEDGEINNTDRVVWVEDIVGTHFGDVDLTKEVNFDDFLAMSASFFQEGGWENGDIDGNAFIDFHDFLILSSNFGMKGDAATASVPEPSNQVLVAISLVCFATLRPRRTFTS